MKRFAMILGVVAATSATAFAKPASRSVPFTVASAADRVKLHGQTDLPASAPKAVVVFFPGSGTHLRDMDFARRDRPQMSFVFKELSERLTAAGLATVRYDERGVSCVGKPAAAADARGRCYDDELSKTINWTTLGGDARAIYDHAAAGPGNRCVIALGHSEGMAHIARLIEAGAAPAGVIAIGAAFESLRGVMFWQRVRMIPESIAASDLDGDGLVTREEFARNLANTPASRNHSVEDIGPLKDFVWPQRGLDKDGIVALQRELLKAYHVSRDKNLAASPGDPYPTTLPDGRTIVLASNAWFRPFLEDWTPEATRLASYEGPIAAFYGTIDAHVEPRRQIAALEQFAVKSRHEIMLTPGLGHALGENGTFAPMREDQQRAIVAAAVRMAADCARGEARKK